MSFFAKRASESVDTLPAYRDKTLSRSKAEDDDASTLAPSTYTLEPEYDEDSSPGSGAFVVTFDGYQLKQDVARAPGGRIMFSTVTEGSTYEKQRVLATKLKDGSGNTIGTFVRTPRGSDKLLIGDNSPVNRKAWLKPGRPFTKTLGSFTHDDIEYKWVSVKDPNQVTLELREESSKALVARYQDSRRDWSIPLPDFVIHRAKIEIYASGLHMIPMIMFSFMVTELVRRDGSVDVMDIVTATGKAGMEGSMAAFTF
ncbi:hypothetical protein SISSUDRAFT_1051508 [Sistotremastrum suecicum HHB10207 ss-3]|uniref:DUF6593 domain-containing protein n=1 Tax=Sistotremastrum suecicum HHB10207 ss-3 TaxID=1314776 RepID=A0A166AI46_9AGAM|nr:hypothetical protein SISSUDRAFT_1051508 [Sistotremastrum suecicum HHB10207 ss-3]